LSERQYRNGQRLSLSKLWLKTQICEIEPKSRFLVSTGNIFYDY
jgi:hypothetical protein